MQSEHSTPAAPRVSYLRIPIADMQGWITGLSDVESGWFVRLLISSAAAELQGYLPNSSNLWTIAGAKRSDFWQSHKSRVLACFEVRQVDGIEYLCFPPLLDLLNKQRSDLQKWRARSHSLTGVDSKDQKQKLSECVQKPRGKTETANAGNRPNTPLERLFRS
ncbi:MAG TPA: hypothetical protein VMG31_11205 [Verrucomicrobiae bacterium]|nr:hypothetical protein [Verrucomicrobiae bacterium]